VEMRDKLNDWLVPGDGAALAAGETRPPVTDIVADAEGALIALGYKPQEASRMVTAVNDDSVADSEDLIRRALKSMVKA
jgi:Holliday junction DNA helicase RuvA